MTIVKKRFLFELIHIFTKLVLTSVIANPELGLEIQNSSAGKSQMIFVVYKGFLGVKKHIR